MNKLFINNLKIVKAQSGTYFPVTVKGSTYLYSPYKKNYKGSQKPGDNIEGEDIVKAFEEQYESQKSGNETVYRKKGSRTTWRNSLGKNIDLTPRNSNTNSSSKITVISSQTKPSSNNLKNNGPLKRFGLSYYDDIEKDYVTLDFDTEELAKAVRKQLGLPGRITDRGETWKGNVIKTDRTKEKSTAYARLLEELPYNNLSFKDAYALARKNNKKYFGYKGKVYKSDLENGEDNMTDLMGIYGNNLGYSKDPKLQTPQSRKAREQYRTDVKASDKYKGENLLLVNPVEEARNKRMAEEYVNLVWGPDHLVDFVDAFMPTNAVGNLIGKGYSTLTGEKFTPKNYASGFNPLGYGRALGKIYDGDILGGLKEGLVRGIDAYSWLGAPGASAVVERLAPKIPVPTYLLQPYHGDAGSTNFVINMLNRSAGKTKNFFTRLVPRNGNGLYGKYSVATSEHIAPEVTSVVSNGTRQYVTGNPQAVQPLYTYFGNTVTNPIPWITVDAISQENYNNQ